MQSGKIVGVENLGTIVRLYIEARDSMILLDFDHTPFRHMFEARGGRIMGYDVDVFLDGEDGPLLGFCDEGDN